MTSEDHLASLASRVSEHVDGLDGVLHAIAFANPEEALGGNFLHTKWPDVATAIQVSAYSLKALTMAALPPSSRQRTGRRSRICFMPRCRARRVRHQRLAVHPSAERSSPAPLPAGKGQGCT